jgi:hypothetical protein
MDLQREMWTIKGNRKRGLISIGLMICQQVSLCTASKTTGFLTDNVTDDWNVRMPLPCARFSDM